jgi:ectoine hydroxylase-related dioxygenase (phytanoyl-CoA dioxygenase family)
MTTATTDAVDFYKKNGYYLRHEPLLPAADFARFTALFEELLAKHQGRQDMMDTPHFAEPRLLEFLLDERVLDVVEGFIGPDIGLWSSHFICKEPGIGRATPWHEDSAYWADRFDSYEAGIVTIWLAIDRSDRGNGCMKVIPGTHLDEAASEYEPVDTAVNTFNRRITGVDESKAVYFELNPNECSFHDSRIIHGADANTSDRRRCGYTMRYFSQLMRYNPDKNRGFKIWHARGRNPHNNPVVN